MISLILVAGGTGSRMGAPIPKQFIPLNGKLIARYSFDLFLLSSEISQLVVVCDPSYQYIFSTDVKPLDFALPGSRRQDSVYNGLQKCDPKAELILIHDSARPFLEAKHLNSLIEAGRRVGAATLAAPVCCTIKQCDRSKKVEKTLDRSRLWEIQTPQALFADLLRRGFESVIEDNLEVTDDVSIAEAIGHPVEIVTGSPRNIKLTTPFDLAVAQTILNGEGIGIDGSI